MGYLIGAFLLLFILDSSAPDSRVVLLDNNKAHNEIIVENETGEVVLDKPYTAVSIDYDESIQDVVPVDVAGLKQDNKNIEDYGFLHPVSMVLYFKLASDELTEQSARELRKIKDIVKSHYPCKVTVSGHTDRRGDEKTNVKLAYKRAKKIYNWIKAQHLNIESLDVNSFGESDPLVPTADGVEEPKNRRVEVFIR